MRLSNSNKILLRQKLILLTVSLIIGLSLLECAVRALGIAPEITFKLGNIRFVDNTKMVYEYVPNSYVGDNCMTNKQGFLDSDFTLNKPKNLVRIAMLGDSITQGAFAPCRKTFSDKLELLLNQRAEAIHSPLRYEVMNFGVGGYNLAAEVETLKEKVIPYKPDIVVLNLFFNDNEPIPGIDLLFVGNYCKLTKQQQADIVRKYVYDRNSLLRKFERNILYKSKLYLFIIYRLNSWHMKNAKLEKLKNMQRHTLNDMTSIYQGFSEIDKLRKQYGFRFLICIHPNLLYVDNINDSKFASIARPFNFYCFNMLSYYKKYGVSPGSLQLKNHPRDTCHPNEFGHTLIAKAIFTELEKHGFIDPKLSDAVNE